MRIIGRKDSVGGEAVIDSGEAGTEVMRQQVLAPRPGQCFLAVTVSDAPRTSSRFIRAGARGDAEKSISTDDLADATASVRAGEPVFSPPPGGGLNTFSGRAPAGAVHPDVEQLTPRERDVLRLIARGYSCTRAALQLDISPRTVETHVSSVLRKLQLSSRHELTAWAAGRRMI